MKLHVPTTAEYFGLPVEKMRELTPKHGVSEEEILCEDHANNNVYYAYSIVEAMEFATQRAKDGYNEVVVLRSVMEGDCEPSHIVLFGDYEPW